MSQPRFTINFTTERQAKTIPRSVQEDEASKQASVLQTTILGGIIGGVALPFCGIIIGVILPVIRGEPVDFDFAIFKTSVGAFGGLGLLVGTVAGIAAKFQKPRNDGGKRGFGEFSGFASFIIIVATLIVIFGGIGILGSMMAE